MAATTFEPRWQVLANNGTIFDTFVDHLRNSYILGAYVKRINFEFSGGGVTTLNSNLARDFFLIKVDHAGNLIWRKTISSLTNTTSSLQFNRIVGSHKLPDNIFIGGSFIGSLLLDDYKQIINTNTKSTGVIIAISAQTGRTTWVSVRVYFLLLIF